MTFVQFSKFTRNTTMTNEDLYKAAIASGRMFVVHIGDSLPKKTPVLKSRRFAMVIGNELHVRKYEDPGHGWLAVPMQWIEALGIVGKISAFSYRRNNTAYLEEDGDMPEFIGAAKRAGFTLFTDYHHTDESSPVRSYGRYSTTGFSVEPNFKESLSNSNSIE